MINITRHDTNQRLSHAVVYNGTVYLSGQVATDRTLDVKGQTREVLQKIDELLKKAGSDSSRILYTQIWLKNIARDFNAMNAVWEDWVTDGHSPARATVQADLATANLLVEIAVTAAVG
jgi:enamine deaminase RidA (YjgF/YER057c/UK114 family)